MKNKQTRDAIGQWVVPGGILVVIVIIIMLNFSSNSTQTASEIVENSLLSVARQNAERITYELNGIENAGKPISYLMAENPSLSKSEIMTMSEALMNNSKAYAVVYCDTIGMGLRQDGKRIDISKTAIFQKLKEGEQEASEKETVTRYLYASEDGLGEDKEVIIIAFSLRDEECRGWLLMYYPVEKIEWLVKKTDFDSAAFYSLINSDGVIMETVGSDSKFTEGENLWDTIKQNPAYSSEVSKAVVKIKNRVEGSLEAEVNGEKRTLLYIPLGINNWSLVVGVNQNYVDNLKENEWRDTKHTIYQLITALLVFFGLVITRSIIERIRNSKKSQELEEKADTDLLTSLNNKLATERKIKEYMENYPEEQALMFVFDLDNFKKINDTLGHAFGDEVLRTLGHQIGAYFRATDVVGRTGGDEFTIFLKHLNDDVLLEKEAKKLCNFFKNFQAGEYVKYAATASIGAAVFPRDGKDFDSLYKAADTALYTAKKRGKSQLAFYGDDSEKSESKKRVEEESRNR